MANLDVRGQDPLWIAQPVSRYVTEVLIIPVATITSNRKVGTAAVTDKNQELPNNKTTIFCLLSLYQVVSPKCFFKVKNISVLFCVCFDKSPLVEAAYRQSQRWQILHKVVRWFGEHRGNLLEAGGLGPIFMRNIGQGVRPAVDIYWMNHGVNHNLWSISSLICCNHTIVIAAW